MDLEIRLEETVHQGTNEFILVGQEPWKQLLTRHLVEWYFHDVVFTHPHEGLQSPIPFGFRPVSLGAAINLG